MLNLCIPVLNNYRGLLECIDSAEKGSLVPDFYYIIDNGTKLNLYLNADAPYFNRVRIISPGGNMGVARSWNIFLQQVSEERVISNDDIIFNEDTLEKMVATPGLFIYCNGVNKLNRFSLYLIRDECIKRVGLFDETISPGYGYYEDNDFDYRMITLENICPSGADCDAIHNHGGSTTLKNYTKEELQQHHKRFNIATQNYIKKWGGLPGNETKRRPYV